MATGTVKFFNEQKGFGFINPDEGDGDIFVHISNVDPAAGPLTENQRVTFEIGEGRKGPEAKGVRPE